MSACANARVPLRESLAALPLGEWTTLAVPLKCLRAKGASMDALSAPFVMQSNAPMEPSLAQMRLDARGDHCLRV